VRGKDGIVRLVVRVQLQFVRIRLLRGDLAIDRLADHEHGRDHAEEGDHTPIVVRRAGPLKDFRRAHPTLRGRRFALRPLLGRGLNDQARRG
jgi:hypothetical protein